MWGMCTSSQPERLQLALYSEKANPPNRHLGCSDVIMKCVKSFAPIQRFSFLKKKKFLNMSHCFFLCACKQSFLVRRRGTYRRSSRWKSTTISSALSLFSLLLVLFSTLFCLPSYRYQKKSLLCQRSG